MFSKKLMSNLALSGLFVCSSLLGTYGQDPQDKVRNVKKEEGVKKVYKDWISKDVAYIITGSEKKAFDKLVTDEERENFIENFWRRRDPDQDRRRRHCQRRHSRARSADRPQWPALGLFRPL